MHWARSIRMPTLPSSFPNGDEPPKRPGDWRWSPSCKRWKTSRTVKPPRWFEHAWIGNMRCPCPWMMRALTPASWWTFVSACWTTRPRISCWSPSCACVASRAGGTAGGKQRTDSTMVLANVRRLSSLESVGETLRAVLNELAEREPEWLLSVISLDWFDRYVHRFELQRFPKGKQAQEALLQQVGQDGCKLLEALQAPQAPQGLGTLPRVSLLQQVWQQHFERSQGRVKLRDGPLVCNEERVVSPYDQEARQSRKRETEWLGYKVHLTETCEEEEEVHLIVQVNTTPATTQDVEETAPLLARLRERELAPETMLLDSGYLSGELIVDQGHKGTQLLGPVLFDTSWQQHSGYGLSAFELDWQQQQARCPQGQLSQSWKPHTGSSLPDTFILKELSKGKERKRRKEGRRQKG